MYKKIKESILKIGLLLLFVVVFPLVTYAFINGQTINDLMGHTINNDNINPFYTNYSKNDESNLVGLSSSGHTVIDTVNHRLFIADTSNNRVVVHQLNASNQLVDNTPDFVLGKPDFYQNQISGANAYNMNGPLGLAIDVVNNRLFVSDSNSRILVFDIATITDGESAVNVLGQTTFTTNTTGLTSSRLNIPRGLHYDQASQRLFVTDSGNNRVLIFDVAAITDGEAAVNVLGQPNFTSGTAAYDSDSLSTVWDVHYDATSTRLFVADQNGFSADKMRVMVFDLATITDGEAAVNVIGKSNFTAVSSATNQSNVTYAYSLDYDPVRNYLFVGGYSRILIFDVNAITDGENAVNVLGQTTYTGSAIGNSAGLLGSISGMVYDQTNNYLYTVDSVQYRASVYDLATITDGESSIDILGQTVNNDGVTDEYGWGGENDGPGTGGFNFGSGVNVGSLAYDKNNHKLFVPDRGNHRILIFNLDVNNNLIDKLPDNILGQTSYYRNNSGSTATGLNQPRATAYDEVNNRLFVADTGNHRVLVYDMNTITDGEAAVNVLGQPNLTTTTSGLTQAKLNQPIGLAYATTTGQLVVADSGNHRVIIYDISGGITNGQNASAVLGQTLYTTNTTGLSQSAMNTPSSVEVDTVGNRIFVADSSNRRVLIFNTLTPTNGQNADVVLGQPDFTTNSGAATFNKLFNNVKGIEYDMLRKRLYVSNGSRHLIFNVSNPTNGMNAIRFISQSAISGSLGTPGTVTNMENSASLYIPETGKLYLVDHASSRISIYEDYLNVEFNKSVATTTNESTLGSAYPLLLFVNGVATTTQTVNIYRSGGTASLSEFTYATHTIAIPPGIYDGTTSTAITINQPTLIDDGAVESTETIIFSISSSSFPVYSEDANGNSASSTTFTLNIADDDVPSVVKVEFSSAATSSANEVTASNFPVLLVNGTLSATSTVDVVITGGTAVGSSVDFTLATTTTITIPPGSYTGTIGTSRPITIPTLINDSIYEGNETIVLTVQNASGVVIDDANSDTSTTTVHTYTITDDDTVGVTVNVTDNLTSEGGSTGTFTIVLNSQPTGSVTIPFTTSDATEGTVGASVTFTTGNWNVPQTVTVTGVDDVSSDGSINYTIITGDITSTDTNYDALDGTTVTDPAFSNQDDDAPGITVTPSGFITTEAGGAVTLQFSLLSQPAGGADVTIPISISDSTEGNTVTTSITILNADWNNPSANVVTITGVDDTLSDGNISYTVVTGDPTSANLVYDGLTAVDVADITLTNNDNEVAGFTIAESGGITSVTEPGTSDTFTVVLNTQPVSNIVLNISNSNSAEATLSTSVLTFTSANWNTPQTVTVTALDDLVLDGTQTYTLSVSVNVPLSDIAYSAVLSQNITTTTIDNEMADSTAPTISSGNISGVTLTAVYNENLLSTSTPLTSDYVVKVNGSPVTISSVVVTGNSVVITLSSAVIFGDTVTLDYTSGASPVRDAAGNNSANFVNYPITNNTSPVTTTTTSGGGIVIPVQQYYNGTTYIQVSNSSAPISNSTTYQQQTNLPDLIGGGEPNVPSEFSNYVCKRYLREYILPGAKNNPEEVKKLQSFLNEVEGESLVVDGEYKQVDIDAVKRFQKKYLDQIMLPWGVNEPTGRVFQTTTAKINLMSCAKKTACPYFKTYLKQGDEGLEAVKVQDFLNIINAPTSGYPTSGIPLDKKYTRPTFENVKEFQAFYKDIVLKPWDLTTPTGWWYQTTRYAANKLMNCDEGEIQLDNGKNFKW